MQTEYYHQPAPSPTPCPPYGLRKSIEAVKDAVPIEDYAATLTELRHSRGKCPVHGGDNPQSFAVYPDEGSGILNWALEGLYRLRQRGHFEVPDAIKEATDSFRENNDIVAVFVEECCETDPEASESGATLYASYKEWCEESGHHPLGKVTVAEEWKRLGFHKYKSKGKARWRGVSVRMPR